MALSESVKADLKCGINLERAFSKRYNDYVIKPNSLFVFECETVAELIEDCNKYPIVYQSENITAICAWLAVKHYDEFIELVINDSPEIIKILRGPFGTFAIFVRIWCDEYDNSENWPTHTYNLIQKLFDDLVDANFNHHMMWSICLEQALIAKDSVRFIHLIDVLEFTDTIFSNKEFTKNNMFRDFLAQNGDIFVEIYPRLDVEFIKATNIRHLCAVKYMINHGYELTCDDLLNMLHKYYTRNINDAVHKFFFENAHLLNSANEKQIDELFSWSIKCGSLSIFTFLLETYNLDLNRTTEIFCYRHNYLDEHDFYYIPTAIRFQNYQIAIELVDRTDLSNADEKMLLQIFETIIWSNDPCDDEIIKRFAEAVNLAPELAKKFLDSILYVRSSQRLTDKISKRLVSLAIKLGCTIDEEYFYKIIEFLDVDAFDYLMKILDMSLADLPENLVFDIVLKNHRRCILTMEDMCDFITECKLKQYIALSIKQSIGKIRKNCKSGPETLYEINRIIINDVDWFVIDWDLFIKLYNFYIQNRSQISEITDNHEISEEVGTTFDGNLLERIDKVVKEIFTIVEKCCDHQTVNENGGMIPKPIIWDEGDLEIIV
jgi:hypothetical protein